MLRWKVKTIVKGMCLGMDMTNKDQMTTLWSTVGIRW